MGNFRVTLKIGNIDRSRFEEVEVLADTGATHTQFPASFLENLGIVPMELRPFVLPSGQRIERHIGEAPLRIDGKVFTCPVVFMEEGAHPVLGTVTLNAFGLGIDSANRRLIPVELWQPIRYG